MKDHTKKQIRVYALLLALLLIAGVILAQVQYGLFKNKDLEEGGLKLGSVTEVMQTFEDKRQKAGDSFENHLEENLLFMTVVLRDEVAEDGFAGQRLYEDGAVLELQGEKVLWPEEMPDAFRVLSAEDVRACGRVEADVSIPEGSDGELTAHFIFRTGQIDGDYYYTQWTNASEILSNQAAYLSTDSFLDRAEEIFGGALLLVSTEDSSLAILHGSSVYPEAESAADLGFTAETISEKQAVVEINHRKILCNYADSEDGGETLIYLRPVSGLVRNALLHTAMILISMGIILGTMIHYIFAVKKYVREHRLSANLSKRYKPDSFRRILIMGGITGAAIIFFTAFVFLSIGSIHTESISSADTMNELTGYLQDVTKARSEYDSRQATEWDVYQANRIARMISEKPERAGSERLQEYCAVFGIDWIMLFDARGKETATNSGLTGMTLDDFENAGDYKRLLKGDSFVVHESGAGLPENLTRQILGVTVPNESGNAGETQGALILAGIPTIRKDANVLSEDDFRMPDTKDRICLVADPETGEILRSSKKDMEGKNVARAGLPEKSLQDGFSDFAMVNGVSSYVTTRRQGDQVFMYILSKALAFRDTLTAALCALAAFIVISWIAVTLSMKDYSQENFEKWTNEAELPDEDLEQDVEDRQEGRLAPNYAELLIGVRKTKWKDMTPDVQTGLILKISNLLLVLIPALFMLGGGGMGTGESSLLSYILYGDWARGLNIFSLCGIVIVITGGMTILLFSNILLSLIAGFAGKTWETVCRILYNVLRYIVFLVVIYYVFEYAGISMSTYIASLSLISIALSLGSKDMVSDILAGVLILFERQFKVGDIVEIDKVKGKVMEIGVRSTKLLCDGNDIRFMSNSSIRNVVNKSQRISACMSELSVVTLKSIEEMEDLFNRELPEIGKKDSRIMGDLMLAGIARVTGGGKADSNKTITVRVSYECREKDSDAVKDFVNRELYLLCERENIQISNQLRSIV